MSTPVTIPFQRIFSRSYREAAGEGCSHLSPAAHDLGFLSSPLSQDFTLDTDLPDLHSLDVGGTSVQIHGNLEPFPGV